jgi:hypothetical protein
MLPLADLADLEARLGRVFDGEESIRVNALLDDASALTRDEAGMTWIDPDTGLLTAVPGSIRAVVLRAAERAVRNPQGFSAESAGDYSYQRTNVEPGVYLTEGERHIIRKAIGRTGLWTQPTTRGDEYLSTVWAEDQFGCELFPLDVYRD